MSTMGKRTAIPAALAIMLLVSTVVWLTGATRAKAEDLAPTASAPAGAMVATTSTIAPPRPISAAEDSLLEVADFVSSDWNYVRVGPVEISTTAVVSRPKG